MRSFLLILLFALPSMVEAQYAVPWYKVAGGGQASSGGAWKVTGTIGQTDADVIELCSTDGSTPGLCPGASWQLAGGFWFGAQRSANPTCGSDLACVFRDGFESSP